MSFASGQQHSKKPKPVCSYHVTFSTLYRYTAVFSPQFYTYRDTTTVQQFKKLPAQIKLCSQSLNQPQYSDKNSIVAMGVSTFRLVYFAQDTTVITPWRFQTHHATVSATAQECLVWARNAFFDTKDTTSSTRWPFQR